MAIGKLHEEVMKKPHKEEVKASQALVFRVTEATTLLVEHTATSSEGTLEACPAHLAIMLTPPSPEVRLLTLPMSPLVMDMWLLA